MLHNDKYLAFIVPFSAENAIFLTVLYISTYSFTLSGELFKTKSYFLCVLRLHIFFLFYLSETVFFKKWYRFKMLASSSINNI